MDRLNLIAEEREVLGKKVKKLRKDGFLPGHVFGKGIDSEHVAVNFKDFLTIYHLAGATGLIDLKIGSDKVKPVMVRDVQYDPISGFPIHIDFYQVNLSEKVSVPVPLELVGDEPESVHLGEAIILQTLNEVEVEALPTDLIEKIEVDISTLKQVDDVISVGQLEFDREKLTIEADEDEVVVKLAPAVTAEMEALLEEQAAETAEAQAEVVAEEGEAAKPIEGETEVAEGETPEGQEVEAKEKDSEGGGNDQGQSG